MTTNDDKITKIPAKNSKNENVNSDPKLQNNNKTKNEILEINNGKRMEETKMIDMQTKQNVTKISNIIS